MRTNAKDIDSLRRVENGRLVFYQRKADIGFWNKYWARRLNPMSYLRAKRGFLATSGRDFMRHLPKTGRIIEAGCGSGHVLMALLARGLDIEGVEWAAETVEKVQQMHPDLPIRVGDVTRLDVPDGHYAGYVSLGVIEHTLDPQPFLAEAFRVLAPGGIAMISVPWFNSLRKRGAKTSDGDLPVIPEALEFYEYAYTTEEFTSMLTEAGFDVNDSCPYGVYRGCLDEVKMMEVLSKLPVVRSIMGRVLTPCLERVGFMRRSAAHMLMLVCRKPS